LKTVEFLKSAGVSEKSIAHYLGQQCGTIPYSEQEYNCFCGLSKNGDPGEDEEWDAMWQKE
jgi:hypothetical protein